MLDSCARSLRAVVLPVAILGSSISTSSTAEAAPTERAQDELHVAFTACDSAMKADVSDAKRQARLGEYVQRRTAAMKADPSLKSYAGALKGKYAVQTWLKRCDGLFATMAPGKGAERRDDSSRRETRTEAKTEMKPDGKVEPAATGKLDTNLDGGASKRMLLKGDRQSIWERQGRPDGFAGENVQSASTWEYRRVPQGTSFVCTLKYVFKGNKLVRKSKSGTGCVLVE